MLIEIKSWMSGAVLFSIETDSWKLAVEAAIKGSADLRYADLRSADLSYADLRSADLRSANLSYADLSSADLSYADLRYANLSYAKGLELFPISISGHKHSLCTMQDGRLAIGCHVLTFDEWEERAEQIGANEGYSALDIEIYKAHIAHIAKTARLLWADKFPVKESAKEVSA